MQNQQRPAGQTSGSDERDAHHLREPVTVLDFLAEAAALRQERSWLEGDRNAKTYVKGPDVRLVLAVLRQGAVMREHRVPGPATVQAVAGRVRLGVGGQMVDVAAGQAVVLDPDLPHDVEALDECVILITIAWSGGVRGDESRL